MLLQKHCPFLCLAPYEYEGSLTPEITVAVNEGEGGGGILHIETLVN